MPRKAARTCGLAASARNFDDNDKRIVFMRHGVTYMNEYLGRGLSFGTPNFSDIFHESELDKYLDTPLSQRGVQQAEGLARSYDNKVPGFIKDCELVVVSPLRRALQTMELALQGHAITVSKNGRSSSSRSTTIPVIAVPEAAERLYLISDVGRPTSTLSAEFPYVDFSTAFRQRNAHDVWWYEVPMGDEYLEWRPVGQNQRYACPAEPWDEFQQRMERLVDWLADRPEKKILVVCHHGVIHWMLNRDFANCQWQDVAFSEIRAHARSRQRNNKL